MSWRPECSDPRSVHRRTSAQIPCDTSTVLTCYVLCYFWICQPSVQADHVYIHLCLKKGIAWVQRQAREYVKWCQIKSWAKSRLQLNPSHFLTCNGVGAWGGGDYIWQPKPFLKWLREWGRLTGTDGTRLGLWDAMLCCTAPRPHKPDW